MSEPICKTCLYYMPHEFPWPDGRCRRFPPQVSEAFYCQPRVEPTAWCGEWKPRLAAVEVKHGP